MSYTPTNEFYAEVAKGNIAGHSIISKFGANSAVPNGTFEIVSELSVAYAGFLAVASTVRIAAGGDVNDDAAGSGAQEVTVEGIDSSGDRAVETIATNGVLASGATTTVFRRVDRAYVSQTGSYALPVNVANILIEDTGTTSNLILITATCGQSLHAHYAVAEGFDAYLIGYEISADSNKPASFVIFSREAIDDTSAPVQAQRIKKRWTGVLGVIPHEQPAPVLIASGQADVWMEVAGTGATSEVSAMFELLIVAQ